LQKLKGEKMTRKIIKIAAAAALFTSGAMAFETNTTGGILVTATTPGVYVAPAAPGTPAAVLELNATTDHGDALVYPYFTQADGWESEIYVRNDGNQSIVAKVALYAADDSQEVKDFNIYLSPDDVFRFTIKDNNIALNEDSVVTRAPRPSDNNLVGEASPSQVKFGDESPYDLPFTEAKKGYVVIYAMAETNATAHHKHVELFSEYRKLLDTQRNVAPANWRDGFGAGGSAVLERGTYKNGLGSPSLLGDGTLITDNGYVWKDPQPTLTGTVKISNESGARDMILRATPMNNFTDGNMVVWTEGETASIADRRFNAVDYSPEITNIGLDAKAFLTKGFFYRFDNGSAGSVANRLVFTQPYKRVLTQLGNLDGYWRGSATTPIVQGTEYQLQTQCTFWDEKENFYDAGGASQTITSPYNGSAANDTLYNKEVVVLGNDDLEKADMFGARYDSTNGYASCTVNGSTAGSGAPAIVTQMIGSNVNDTALINWIYTVKQD